MIKKIYLYLIAGFLLMLISSCSLIVFDVTVKNKTKQVLNIYVYPYFLGAFRDADLFVTFKSNRFRLFDEDPPQAVESNHIELSPNMDGIFHNNGSGLSGYNLHFFTRGVLIRIYDNNNKHISSIKFLPDKPQKGYHPNKVFIINDKTLLLPIDNETIYPVSKPNPKEIPLLMKELTVDEEWGIDILDRIRNNASYIENEKWEKSEPTIIDIINNHFPLKFNYDNHLSKKDRKKEIKQITSWWNENKDYLFWDNQYDKYIIDLEAKSAGIPTEEYRKAHPWTKEENKK